VGSSPFLHIRSKIFRVALGSTSQGIRVHVAMVSLWEEAVQQLDPKQHRHFESGGASSETIFLDLLATLDNERERCERGRWRIRGANGEQIILRDVYMKMANSIKTFVEVMDVAVQFDPVHTALPWAGIRLILQVRGSLHRLTIITLNVLTAVTEQQRSI